MNPRHEATHVEKVRRIFDEMSKDGHMVSLEGFLTTFQRCRIDLPSETIRELFQHAAVTNEVMMTFSEFQMWAEQYPTILDCLFFRSKDAEEDLRQQNQIRDLKDVLQAAKHAGYDAENRHRQAIDALQESRQSLESLERRARDAQAHEVEAKQKLEEARNRSAQHRLQLREEQGLLANVREEERQWQHRIEGAQKDTQAALTSLRAAEAELRELQRELERRIADVDASKNAVRTAYDREGHLAQEAEGVARRARDTEKSLASLEDTVQLCTASEQEAMIQLRDATEDTIAIQEALDKTNYEMKGKSEKIFAAAGSVDAASTQAKDLARQLENLERINTNFSAQRMNTNEEEIELITEEVALRRQRIALENREAKLRNRSYSRRASTSPDMGSRGDTGKGSRGTPDATRTDYISSRSDYRSPASAMNRHQYTTTAYISMSPHTEERGRPGHVSRTDDYARSSTIVHKSPSRWDSPPAPQDRGRMSDAVGGRSPSHLGGAGGGYGGASDTPRRMGTPRRDHLRSPPNTGGNSASPGTFSPSGYDTGRYPRPSERPPPRVERPPSRPPSSSTSASAIHQEDSRSKYENAERMAKALYEAMKGFGTDEDAVYKTLSKVRTNGEWAEIRSSFKRNYPKFHGGDLMMAMRDDLTKKEFERCDKILSENGIVMRA